MSFLRQARKYNCTSNYSEICVAISIQASAGIIVYAFALNASLQILGRGPSRPYSGSHSGTGTFAAAFPSSLVCSVVSLHQWMSKRRPLVSGSWNQLHQHVDDKTRREDPTYAWIQSNIFVVSIRVGRTMCGTCLPRFERFPSSRQDDALLTGKTKISPA